MKQALIVPSDIDWSLVKGRDLEECVYWILDAIGAKSIDWRLGGTGGGAADGGRDLECILHIPQPTGEVIPQNWWVEAKGRANTVPREEVQASIITVAGRRDVDVHLFVTNTQLSNPTKDWIREWKASHSRPDVRVWERSDLERLVSQNPIVALRLFKDSLTPNGRKEAFSTKFWDYIAYGDQQTLRKLWAQRDQVEWDERAYFAAIASELANGDLSKRPWGVVIPSDELLDVYLIGLLSSFSLWFRANDGGIDIQPIIKTLAHLFMQATIRLPARTLAVATERFSDFGRDFPEITQEARDLIIEPVFATVYYEIGQACLADCSRVITSGKLNGEKEAEHYWDRFRETGAEVTVPEEEESEKRILYLEANDGKCRASLTLNEANGCPLLDIDRAGATWEERINTLRPVLISRIDSVTRQRD